MRTIAIIVIIAALLGGAAWQWGPGAWARWSGPAQASAPTEDQLFTVRRQKLVIDVTESGNLRAVKHHRVMMKLKSFTKGTITWLVPEGTDVKKGDPLIKLDKQPILDEIEKRQVELEKAKKDQAWEEENAKIEISLGESFIASAQERLNEATEALKKFTQWDAPNKIDELDKAIAKAQEDYEQANKEHADAVAALDAQAFGDPDVRKQLEKLVDNAEKKVDLARQSIERTFTQKRIYQRFNYPRELQGASKKVESSKLDLRKEEVGAKAKLQKINEALKGAKDAILKVEKRLNELKEDLNHSVISAPVSGIVLYGNQGPGNDRRSYGGDDNDLKIGGTVYQGRAAMTIPEKGAYEIDLEVGEQYRARLRPGNTADIFFDAIPDLKLQGTLKEISRYARPKIRWDPSSPRVFSGTIDLTGTDERMVSGLTTRVRIVVETVPDALVVPIEAVFNIDGKTVCRVYGAGGTETREVTTGKSNDDYVQITNGLVEGDKVYLFDPAESAEGSNGGDAPSRPAPSAGPAAATP